MILALGSVYKRADSDLDPSRPIIVVGLAHTRHVRYQSSGCQLQTATRQPLVAFGRRTRATSEMRLLAITLLTVVGMCYAALLSDNYPTTRSSYIPPQAVSGGSGGFRAQTGQQINNDFRSAGNPYQSSYGVNDGGQNIPIVSYSNENTGDGNYQFSYETGNGISVQETGQQQGKAESVSGSFSYTGPDGAQYSISYTADENGFHPQGAHLPTPPPIPPEIQRGVELALAAEARGENQDGSYSERESGNAGSHAGGLYQGPNSYQTGAGYRY